MYFQYQIPDTVFRDPNKDALTYKLVAYKGEAMPPWLVFISQNRTLLGVPKDREGETFSVLIEVDDGRGGSVSQIVTISVNPNYTMGKMVPLVMIGVLPMIVMFVFVFTLGFAKVPPLP